LPKIAEFVAESQEAGIKFFETAFHKTDRGQEATENSEPALPVLLCAVRSHRTSKWFSAK
jgi:hypothetical protein